MAKSLTSAQPCASQEVRRKLRVAGGSMVATDSRSAAAPDNLAAAEPAVLSQSDPTGAMLATPFAT